MSDDIGSVAAREEILNALTQEVERKVLRTTNFLLLNIRTAERRELHKFLIRYDRNSLFEYHGKHRAAYEAVMSDGQNIEQRREIVSNYREYLKAELQSRKADRGRRLWDATVNPHT